MGASRKNIPGSVIRRLTRYLTEIQTLRANGRLWVSSKEIASILGLTSSTVRQDLSHLDFMGISKRGYSIPGLEKVLKNELGADVKWKMIVVGAGNLGTALALHEEFVRRDFNIMGIFDKAPDKAGTRVGSLVIREMNTLPAMIKREKIDIGIIAVPAAAAQEVADILVNAGIRGLLNLALTHISVPGNIAVIDARIFSSLLELSHGIKCLN